MDPTRGLALLPANCRPARLIVCERTGQWAVGLVRELAGAKVPVFQTRSLAECWDALGESPASMAIVELTSATVADLAQRLTRLGREFPLARVAVVADRSLAAYEWLMREAGAVHFVCSPRGLRHMGELACNHLAGAPSRPQGLEERIWSSLPWERRAVH